MFLSNRIDDAFAVVDVGVPGVGETGENRKVATSEGTGKARVPELRSYQAANIGIDTSTLPSDVEIAEQSANILPGDRNGVDVKLSARSSRRSALLVLRDVEGKFIPVGARAHILGSDAELIVGYEGEAYVPSAAAENELVVDLGPQYCRARFSFSESAEMQQRIDPVVCQ
jgi:outer membrane usher protein